MGKQVHVRFKSDDQWTEIEVPNFYDPVKHHTVRTSVKDNTPFYEMKLADGRIYNKVTAEWRMDDTPKVDAYYKLHLGCGHNRFDGWVNIDCFDAAGVMKLDLEEATLPFKDESVTHVKAEHFMEHIKNFIPLMNEIHRVLVPNGEVHIIVPVYPFAECFQDPTHVRFFTQETFNYFWRNHFLWEHCGQSYGIKPFNVVIIKQENTNINVLLRK